MSIYDPADEAMKILGEQIGAEFQNLSVTLRFDELNVIETRKKVTAMYNRIHSMVKKQFRKIIRKVAKETRKELGVRHVPLDDTLLLISLFGRYDPLTQYVYTREWKRKRDRLVEGLMSTKNRREMRRALRRGMDVLQFQIQQYGDILTDDVRIQIFQESGIEKVQWVTQRDAKVCQICADRDTMIYPIDNVPTKHYRCRCYLLAYE